MSEGLGSQLSFRATGPGEQLHLRALAKLNAPGGGPGGGVPHRRHDRQPSCRTTAAAVIVLTALGFSGGIRAGRTWEVFVFEYRPWRHFDSPPSTAFPIRRSPTRSLSWASGHRRTGRILGKGRGAHSRTPIGGPVKDRARTAGSQRQEICQIRRITTLNRSPLTRCRRRSAAKTQGRIAVAAGLVEPAENRVPPACRLKRRVVRQAAGL